MVIERFYTPGLAQVAYGIADPETKQAAIIDPRRDVDEYLAWAHDHGYSIVAILETHVHADFVSGARELAAATGATIYASPLGELAFPHRPLDDGDVVQVGDLRLRALWTPGHTPEHLAYLLYEAGNGEQPAALFSGDVLFAGEIGRPDLLGEEQQRSLVNQLYTTVSERLPVLADDLVVYPGHGAGSPCGKQIGDAAQTTIGQEKRFNYAFQTASRDDFARKVMEGMPTPPAYYPVMKRVNREGPPLLAELPAGEPLSVERVAELQDAGALVIDGRPASAFAEGHIPGAISVGLGPNFPLWSGWLTPYDRDVVLVLPDDDQFAATRTELRRIGVDRVAGYLAGGMSAWRKSGGPVARFGEAPVNEVAARLREPGSDLQVLDVRDGTEWRGGHIAGSSNVSAGALAQGADVPLDRDAPVAVICGSGYRSSLAASLLQARGVNSVIGVPGGMAAWQEAGLPTE